MSDPSPRLSYHQIYPHLREVWDERGLICYEMRSQAGQTFLIAPDLFERIATGGPVYAAL